MSSVTKAGIDAPGKWRRLHEEFARALVSSLQVSEPPPGADVSRPLDERLVQAIWCDQLLRLAGLKTASGKRVEVVEPGIWNTGRGPDFTGARLRIAGAEHAGDIEVHVDTTGWRTHGHHQDFAYNRVIAHVVLRAGDDRPHDEKQNGERLERIVLEPFLEPDLETIRRTISLDDYPYGRPEHLGLCHEAFVRLPKDNLADFLATAGRARVEDRIARFAAQLANTTFEQLIYQAVMTGQGYKANKTLYFLLSRRAPLAELTEMARDLPPSDHADLHLSILLHVAQLVPSQQVLAPQEDDETRAFAHRLSRLWSPVVPYFSDRIMPPTKRWMAGMRPAGFPWRRLAAVAVLVGRLLDASNPLFDRFRAAVRGADPASLRPTDLRRLWGTLTEPFTVTDPSHYFARHFTLGGKSQNPQALLGEPAARTLLFNVLLPLAILRARQQRDSLLEERAWQLLLRFPALDENSVTRFMKRRLLGDEAGDALFATELMQQSLIKIFADCCAHNERTCADCTFIALGERLRAEGVSLA